MPLFYENAMLKEALGGTMSTIYAKYDELAFVPTKPVKIRLNQMVAITLVDDDEPLHYKEADIMSFAGTLSDSDGSTFETAVRETRQVDESGW